MWFAGGAEPTSADFMMLWPMIRLQTRSPVKSEKVDAYVQHIKERCVPIILVYSYPNSNKV